MLDCSPPRPPSEMDDSEFFGRYPERQFRIRYATADEIRSWCERGMISRPAVPPAEAWWMMVHRVSATVCEAMLFVAPHEMPEASEADARKMFETAIEPQGERDA